MSMFQSKIFKFNGTAWNPYHARNFLLVSEDERTFLNTIPGWADKVSSCAVVIEKAESAVVDVHSIGLIETAAVQTIPSKEELLKSFLKFEAISNLKEKSTTSVVDTNNRALSKCKSLSNLCNIRTPVFCETRSSSLPDLFKTTEFLYSKIKHQNNVMENINLNQTYTVQYQRQIDNCREKAIFEVDEFGYLKKDKINSYSENGEAENHMSKTPVTDSIGKVNGKQQNFEMTKTAFRIDDHKMNDENQNKKSDINVEEQNKSIELQHNENLNNSKLNSTEDDIPISQEIPCAQPISSDLSVFSLIGASSQSVKEMHVVESTEIPEKSQIVTVNEKQCVEKVETVPLHSVEDVHVKSTEVEHHSPPQPVMEEHARPSEDKNNSQIMIIDSEGRVKEIETLISESEQMPAAKVSRKRKHTKDKSKKGSTSSKSARKPDIFYSDTELKSMLNCLKLCLKLV
ncbi:uncharacterized protein LOC129226146 isoform X1 [Uloborus diversus]|uniref:uncharacterized protein LOC129226146 isoform X1 n=1 Tax=Uloborus diversus TaxID=327109 RepID=UPI002409F9D8|nr:uncharacterized protein LOC129226146 isoform X1 [Uloborus diversus]